ncbi:SusD family protein [Mucilaginibacter gossypiicola]|uniref:SusD family protein n=1 Tax=Mucilaginibacter gossypiicola TaxID=551995 RepID=A0A1H8LW54_9SPHI|nr:RagB/SusD family nutrient uptake outer membrane protein [Mucilaginibacter gossypiicola]SEO09260.1 SusD family protein [Mucilaginibacter gossypiicola]
MKTANIFIQCQNYTKHLYNSIQRMLLACSLLCVLNSCNKQDDFLAAKTNSALAVPVTLDDYQSLMQNQGVLNIKDPALGQIATDDFYVTKPVWSALATTTEIKGYIWDKVVYDAGANILDWSSAYKAIYYANVVLDALPKIKVSPSEQGKYNEVKGDALFYRSVALYNLVQTFAMPFDKKTAESDLGIPLRLNSDLKAPSVRSSVKQCYDQILSDLKIALALLPQKAAVITSPSQLAAQGYLARINLAIGNYDQAFKYADLCLKDFDVLTNFNDLVPSSASLSNTFLTEEIFHATLLNYGIIAPNSKSITDSVLYASYEATDLRKTLFFRLKSGLPYFKGSYDFKGNLFSGLANDEIYLIRAECLARLGDKNGALTDLNNLLSNRYVRGAFAPLTAVSPEQVLLLILKERRKELLYRGLRWTDLRRFSKEPQYAVSLFRNIDGKTYSLEPKSPRYAWPIPDNEVLVNNLPQNPR